MSVIGEHREERAHTRPQALWFTFRTTCFRLAHLARDLTGGTPHRLPSRPSQPDFSVTVARSTSELYVDGVSATERAWQLGKVENLRRALRSIDGVTIPAGGIFSFWRQVGPPWSVRGFRPGRELREGCLVPSVGGGLCQLSNALYDCALKAGCRIVERHRHTKTVPGSLAEIDRDATVFWNYVDLRFEAKNTLHISARLTASRLEVSFHAREAASSAVLPSSENRLVDAVENCATCGVASCLRHAGPGGDCPEQIAVLLDEFWPEFDEWLRPSCDRSHLLVPMRFSRWRRGAYAWNDRGWRSVRDAPALAIRRAWRSRRLAAQGAARQKALLGFDKKLALALAGRAPWQSSRAIVPQNLLPWLHESGWTGGRSTTVLLTRWPIRLLQQRLDTAAARHPGSPTLADFRADPELADLEWKALEESESLVTCHAALAKIWPEKTRLLPWKLPAARGPRTDVSPLVAFPASGLARKGAIELRDALRGLRLPVRVVGTPQLESNPDFWRDITLAPPAPHWLDGVGVVALPAWIEHRPRRLLEAIAARVPVIATDACGLHDWPSDARVSIIPCGDTAALVRELENALAPAPAV